MSNAEIVVVGAGVAGLSAALAVADAGQDVTLVTKADLVESNTYHAQGGIAAAVFADDDPKLHAADTMAAGHGLCEPRAVEILTREGADRVRQFAAAGVHFDRSSRDCLRRQLRDNSAAILRLPCAYPAVILRSTRDFASIALQSA